MNTTWSEFLATHGARFDGGLIADFGHPAEELGAAKTATVVVPLLHLGVIECAGEDATTFLQNQLTSDVNHLAAGTAQHSSWCTHKGRMQASFVFYRHASGYCALLASDLLETTQKQLQRYVLRSKVSLRDLSSQAAVIGVAGPRAAEALQAAGLAVPAGTMTTAEAGGSTVIRLDAERFIVVADRAAAPACYEQLATVAQPAGHPVWQWLDICAGIVLVTAATKEEFVPQMVNFDRIGGVSFHKGCYPGQEIVARTQYLGKIKRHLYRVSTDGVVSPATSLYQADNREQSCGLIATAAPAPEGGFVALAVIREEVAEADTLRLEIPGVAVLAVEAVMA